VVSSKSAAATAAAARCIDFGRAMLILNSLSKSLPKAQAQVAARLSIGAGTA
jgi:hypothetical protein